MMYITLTELLEDLPKNELINLCNDEARNPLSINLEDSLDEVVIRAERAIADGSERIDSYLRGGGYEVPLISCPPLIKKLSKDISSYFLYCRRFRENIPYQEVYDRSIKDLEKIQEGVIVLGGTESEMENETGGAVGNNRSSAFDWDKY